MERWLRDGRTGITKWNALLGSSSTGSLHPSLVPEFGAIVQQIELKGIDLSGLDLSGAMFMRTRLNGARFIGAKLDGVSFGDALLRSADFTNASLRNAKFGGADLMEARFCKADLTEALLHQATCLRTDFSNVTIERANLTLASFVDASFEGANVSGCSIYGLSAWGLNLERTTQRDLVITAPHDEACVTVDSLEMAQFIHLLLQNKRIRNVIDNITTKVILILGRFTPERKVVLNAIRNLLRSQNYCPVMFDFEKPASRSYVETVSTLAHLARFIVADFTDPKIVLHEIGHVVGTLAIPVLPLLQMDAGAEPATLQDIRKGRTFVLPTYRYKSVDDLLKEFPRLLTHANEKASELDLLSLH